MTIKPTFLTVHSVSCKCVYQHVSPSSDSKVLAVPSWDGVPRKNQDEPLNIRNEKNFNSFKTLLETSFEINFLLDPHRYL